AHRLTARRRRGRVPLPAALGRRFPRRGRPSRAHAPRRICARTLRAADLRRRGDPCRGGVMDFDIPEELALLARTVRDFVETRLQPIEKQVEASDEIPTEAVRELAALGFL